MLTALRGRSRELARTAGGVLYPRPNPGVADGATLLYQPAPKRGTPIALPAGSAANTEGAMTTVLAAGSAPTGDYAVTHLLVYRNSGDDSRIQTIRIRGIGQTAERRVDLSGPYTAGAGGYNAIASVVPPLLVPGGVGLEAAVTANGINGPISQLYAVIQPVRPTADGTPWATGATNYRYPLYTANASGVAVTSTATAWAAGAYVEVATAVAGGMFEVHAVSITPAAAPGEVTLAYGAAGSEAGYEVGAFPTLPGGGILYPWQTYALLSPIRVPGGSRIAAKLATSGTTARTARVAIHGLPVPYTEAPAV